MASPDGTPIWYELMTTDIDGAQAFYADVVGWSVAPSGMPDTGDYRLLIAPDGTAIGGLMTLPAGAPASPRWTSYIGVADVDGAVARVTQLGGSVHMAPHDMPGVGRFALVADPHGMPFYVMRGDGDGESRAFDAAAAQGHCAWHELATTDHGAALAFYGALFGWENNETMAMGPMGDYCFLDNAGTRIGAAMTAGEGFPTRWSYYFAVPSVDAARDRAVAAGGTITQGPHEVPGGMHIVMGADPQGAAFALVGGK